MRLLLLLALLVPMAARAAEPLGVVAFAGASNWPVWIAQERGFFEKNGVAVTLAFTPNSVQLVQDMIAGKYGLAMTAVDNVVAYDEGQGEAPMPAAPELVALFGCDNGMLSLMAQPEIAAVADLKGKTLSVDAMSTGFAFVLRALVGRAGLTDSDVAYEKVGGGQQRLQAFLDHRQAATLLNSPLDLIAEAKGGRRLATAVPTLGAYQGIVATARRPWLAEHEAAVVGYIRGYKAAIDWLYEPVNHAAAIDVLVHKANGITPELAERVAAVLLASQGGLYRDLAIDPAGMATVLALRSQYAEPRKALTDPKRYMDDRYLALALGGH